MILWWFIFSIIF